MVDLKELTPAEAKERDFQSYFKMGLVTQAEWELCRQQEEDGVQAWRTVYTWAAALLAEAVAAGRMEDRLVRAAKRHRTRTRTRSHARSTHRAPLRACMPCCWRSATRAGASSP